MREVEGAHPDSIRSVINAVTKIAASATPSEPTHLFLLNGSCSLFPLIIKMYICHCLLKDVPSCLVCMNSVGK